MNFTQLLRSAALTLGLLLVSVAARGADDPYNRWAVAKFGATAVNNPALQPTVWGEQADPDGDGLRNLLEYTADTNPNAWNQLSDCYHYSVPAGGAPASRFPQLIAWLRTDDPDLRVVCPTSPDLGIWWPNLPIDFDQPPPSNPYVFAQDTGAVAPGLRQMRYTDAQSLANRPGAFMRLLIARRGQTVVGPGLEPFSLTSQTARPHTTLNPSVVRSNTIVLGGFTGTLSFTIPAGVTLYVNGVAVSGSTAVVKSGDHLWMEAYAPGTAGVPQHFDLTIGGHTARWSITASALAAVPTGSTALPSGSGGESGYTPVEAGVSETGAAQISIPIVVSPGTAGMQPKLAISYSSQGGNGPLGLGFSLSGLSAIARTGRTVAQDGVKGGVNFNDDDRYTFDGQRLIAISGLDGGQFSEYRLEFDPTTRIVGQREDGSAQQWTVETKAGLTMRFGSTVENQASSRIRPEGSARTLVWAIGEIEDTTGNRMQFFYDEAARLRGEMLITRISYTRNAPAGFAPQQEVVFEYEDRPDTRTSYVAGYATRMLKRLRAVEARATEGGTMKRVRRYEMTYQQGEISGPSQLTQVQEITADGTQLPATVFAWDTNGNPNMTTTTAAQTPGLSSIGFTASPPGFMVQGDFDGDGRMDVMHLDDGGNFMLARGQSDGSFQVTQPVADFTIAEAVFQSSGNLRTGDFNADGKTDLLYLSQTPARNWLALSRGNNTFEIRKGAQLGVFQNVGISVGYTQVLALDVNGDGRTDVVVIEPSDGANRPNRVFLASTAASFTEVDPGAAFRFLRVSDARPTYSWVIPGDYNGDGLPDILHLYWNGLGHWLALSNGDGTFTVRTSNQLGGLTNQSFHRSYSYWVSGDYNGDGLTDVANFNNQGVGMVFQCRGDGTFTPVSLPASLQGRSVSDPQYAHFYGGDVNGDGVSDIFHAFFSHNATLSFLAYSTGNNSFATFVGAAMGALSQQRYYDPEHVPESRVFVGDFDGDGTDDFLGINHSIENYLTRSNGFDRSRIVQVTNGHGGYTRFSYSTLTDAATYTKGTGLTYPFVELQMPMSVVNSVSSRNGIDGNPFTGVGAGTFGENTVTYRYEGAWSDLNGRGFQGFKAVETTDGATGIINLTQYQSGNPLLGGRPTAQMTYLPDGRNISRTDTAWTYRQFDVVNGSRTVRYYFPYASETATRSFEINQGLGASYVKASRVFNVLYDNYGNLLQSTTETYPLGAATVFTEAVVNTYADAPTPTKWHLGRLSTSSVTKFATGMPSLTRSSSFAYHATTGLLTQEVIEPSGGVLRQQKDYSHDGFGNILTSTISTAGESSRVTVTSYSTDGRFVATTTNAASHSESKTYDPLLGNVLTQTGPNGLTTRWEYDALGRPIRELRPDGTETRSFYRRVTATTAGAPPRAVHFVRVQSSGGSPKTVWYDLLDREIRTDGVSFDGRTVSAHKVYNARGEVTDASQPYFAGDTPLYSVMLYDAVGREYQQTDPGSRVTKTTHDGLTTTVERNCNPAALTQFQKAVTTVNAMGWTVSSSQYLGTAAKTISRTHDAYGSLKTVTDPAGNMTSLDYDVRGNKIAMSEPNSGASGFTYNGFGELKTQTNAAGQQVSLNYDVLGRVLSRTEPEGTTAFIYDSAARGIGQLASEQGPGFSRSYFYDALSRPTATVETHGFHRFATSRSYDAYGRPDALTFPTGLGVRQSYTALGHLGTVQNAANPSQFYWSALQVNARGQLTQEVLGNGVVTDRAFDPQTGLVDAITASFNAAGDIQKSEFDFDLIGNLTERRDRRFATPFIETFGYDTLNRLETVDTTGRATASANYNDLGNITSRSDVGAFAYARTNGAGPHAITGISGSPGGSFDKACAYNAKGERVTDGATALDYSSFGKPTRIRKGGDTLAFAYGPDRALFR
jgi:YD repeat-containing protein